MKDTAAGGIRATQGTFSSFHIRLWEYAIFSNTFKFQCLFEYEM